MTTVAAQPFSGTYRAQPEPSTFAFAVRHSGVFWYRGTLSDVAATLRGDGDALALEGCARVDSISVVHPAAMRASVLGLEFFDAENHPEITFNAVGGGAGARAGTDFCRAVLPREGQTQYKFAVNYPLPGWGLQFSATYQNLPGAPIAADRDLRARD